MDHNLRTFDYYGQGRKLPTFAQALNWNGMMKEPTKAFLDALEPKVGPAMKSQYLPEVWGGLMGLIDIDDEVTVMPSSIDLTMPVEYAAIVRKGGGITAAFAYCEILKELARLSPQDIGDDLEVQIAMRRAWKEFENRVREANVIQEGYGCDASQSWLTLRDIGAFPKSDSLKKKMIAIAKLAGRMYKSFSYQRKQTPNDNPEEVVGSTSGPQIDRVLSSELALLADSDTEDVAAMKILEHRAPITEMKGNESTCRGPLVILIDESGSMHDGDENWGIQGGHAKWNGRNTWAKACAVALVRIAWAENRRVIAIHFGSGTQVQDIPKDNMRALFEMARSFVSGGTAFGPALKRGRALVMDLEAEGHKGADIMLITDGEESDYVSHNREIDHMDREGVRLWTIAIGMDISSKAPVRTRAEKYTYAPDRMLKHQEAAIQLAAGFDKAAMGNRPGTGGMVN